MCGIFSTTSQGHKTSKMHQFQCSSDVFFYTTMDTWSLLKCIFNGHGLIMCLILVVKILSQLDSLLVSQAHLTLP